MATTKEAQSPNVGNVQMSKGDNVGKPRTAKVIQLLELISTSYCQQVDFKMGIITLGLCTQAYKANNWKQKLHHCSCPSIILLYNWDSRPDSAETSCI